MKVRFAREDGTVFVTDDGKVMVREADVTDLRTQILVAIGTRLLTILTANGYETELGENVFVWRDLTREPFASSELSGIAYNDVSDESEPLTFEKELHRLTVEMTIGASGETVESTLRLIAADLEVALNTDRTFGALAMESLLGTNEIAIEHVENKIGILTVPLNIEYTTLVGDPYHH